MKGIKYIALFVFVLICASIKAQQLTHWSFFTYNYMQYNPAVTGTTPCLELKFGYRRQWRGFDGAPRTAFANVHGKIPPKKWNYLGLGATIENDDAGPFSYTSMQVMGAYHMRMAKKYYLSAGMSLGFAQYHVNFGDMTLEQQDIDPVITSSLNDFVFPIISTGLWLYRDDRFYGLSVRNVSNNKIDKLGDSRLNRHWTISSGRAIKLSKELVFKPAILVNYVGKSRASLDAQFLMEFKEKVSAGLAGRSGHGISALLKISAFKYVTVAYSYDLTVNKVRYAAAGSHEVIIGIRACKAKGKYDVPCAAYE